MLAVITKYHCHNQLQTQILVTDTAPTEDVLFQVYKHYGVCPFNISKLS